MTPPSDESKGRRPSRTRSSSGASEARLSSDQGSGTQRSADLHWQILYEHRWLIAAVIVYLIAAAVAVQIVGPPAELSLSLYFAEGTAVALLSAGTAIALAYAAHFVAVRRPPRPIAHLVRHLRSEIFTRDRMAAGLMVVVLLPAFISTFSSMKAMISVVHPFSLDPALAELDRALHGGVAPWRLLQPILGRPLVTSAMSFFYALWFFATFAALLWYAFSRRARRLRMRFLLSFVLSWILLGTVAATALSSAGPCYFGRVTGLGDPFAPLMDYLHRADQLYPVWALSAQEQLWELHESSTLGLGAGISAMPSMHVATTFLIFLAVRRTSRIAGFAAAAFFALILAGSVHLGWHYAIDAYAGVVGAWAVWWTSGRWLDRYPTVGDHSNSGARRGQLR